MKVEQIYTSCLAEAAYYIESNGEVAIIDPLRESKPYLDKANQNGAKIKFIFETHFHADFVSGHLSLSKITGAPIVFGPTAKAEFDLIEAKDNQEFKVGDVTIKVLHTPGHTMESVTYLLIDEDGNETAIFTGDTLFLGDVGRPDLAVKSDLTREDLASLLFDSLRNKIMPLSDTLTVYPAHGAGSACGKNMSSETIGNLGDQKKNNYALRADMTKEEFISEVLDGISSPPQYFPKNVMMNKTAIPSLDKVMETASTGLSPDEVETHLKEGVLVIDTRKATDFTKGFIPNSLYVGIDGSYAVWVGTLVTNINQKIIIVAEEGREEEAITRLARVGYDNVIGYLIGGISNWKENGKSINTITDENTDELAFEIEKGAIVLDVRKETENFSEHIPGAINEPLDTINSNISNLDKDKKYHIHCAGGYRSVVFASILLQNGFKSENLVNVLGGFNAIKESNIRTSEYACPSTM